MLGVHGTLLKLSPMLNMQMIFLCYPILLRILLNCFILSKIQHKKSISLSTDQKPNSSATSKMVNSKRESEARNLSWQQYLINIMRHPDTQRYGHSWRSKDDIVIDILLWRPTHWTTSVGRPSWMCIMSISLSMTLDASQKNCRNWWMIDLDGRRESNGSETVSLTRSYVTDVQRNLKLHNVLWTQQIVGLYNYI